MKPLLLLAAALAASAQTPAFELATVKPSDPASTMAIRRSGHRIVTVNTSLLFLITWAYDIHPDRLYNKPAWLDSVHYDVTGAGPTDDGASFPRRPGQPGPYQLMMQTLLAERFHLAVHTETRELPLYALTVAKGGPKFKLGPAPASMGQNPFRSPRPGVLIGEQVSAAMLANVLSGQLDRSVQDFTSLNGVFDFQLQWQPDALALRTDVAPLPADPGRPSSLFTAIQEQLGLRLESRKGPVLVLVIDRVDNNPTAN